MFALLPYYMDWGHGFQNQSQLTILAYTLALSLINLGAGHSPLSLCLSTFLCIIQTVTAPACTVVGRIEGRTICKVLGMESTPGRGLFSRFCFPKTIKGTWSRELIKQPVKFYEQHDLPFFWQAGCRRLAQLLCRARGLPTYLESRQLCSPHGGSIETLPLFLFHQGTNKDKEVREQQTPSLFTEPHWLGEGGTGGGKWVFEAEQTGFVPGHP